MHVLTSLLMLWLNLNLTKGKDHVHQSHCSGSPGGPVLHRMSTLLSEGGHL